MPGASSSAQCCSTGWRLPAVSAGLDVGCGSGAFSELLYTRCALAEIEGVDPAEAQLTFARSRPAARVAQFRIGEATVLPSPDDRFDAAVMALVIFFLSDAARAVAEMARVVKAGGIVAAYAWDMTNGGLPTEPIVAELREMGFNLPLPANPGASRLDLRELWAGAGIEALETREISVTRTFTDFDNFWTITAAGSSGSGIHSRVTRRGRHRASQASGEPTPVSRRGRASHVRQPRHCHQRPSIELSRVLHPPPTVDATDTPPHAKDHDPFPQL